MKNYLKESFSIKSSREWLLALFDIVSVAIGLFISVLLSRFHEINTALIIATLKAMPVLIVISFLVFVLCKIPKRVWRYAGLYDYARLSVASCLAVFIFSLIDYFLLHFINDVPTYLISIAIITVGLTFSRIFYASLHSRSADTKNMREKERVMIIGAGYTAKSVLEELTRESSVYKPVCMIDDDVDKMGRTIYGVQIVGSTREIPKYARRYNVDAIIFAIPSISEKARKTILNDCMATGSTVKVLPFMSEMIRNVDLLSQVKDVNIEDLLGRPPITFEVTGVKKYITDKVVLVTGGGGSIGSELCRQIAKHNPKKLIILDVYENSSYVIQQELLRKYGDTLDLHIEIASVTDYTKIDEFFQIFKPQIIFHAAAHKHVPLMETNPEEAVKNNVFGTFNVASLALKHGAQKFIMISTDKAVNPTNVMGATKRTCEKIVQSLAQHSAITEFASVRFGNVLGSNGSVIPLFKEQILKGGPVTVTHKDIIRYFMTIPEAVSLVLQAGAFAAGGEIFVLDMGDPVKVVELAENIIRMLGHKPYEDIEIKFTGLRPGEKLYEELLMNEEGLSKTPNNKIFIGHQMQIDSQKLFDDLEEMRHIVDTNDKAAIVEKLKQIVSTFTTKETFPTGIDGLRLQHASNSTIAEIVQCSKAFVKTIASAKDNESAVDDKEENLQIAQKQ